MFISYSDYAFACLHSLPTGILSSERVAYIHFESGIVSSPSFDFESISDDDMQVMLEGQHPGIGGDFSSATHEFVWEMIFLAFRVSLSPSELDILCDRQVPVSEDDSLFFTLPLAHIVSDENFHRAMARVARFKREVLFKD